MSDITVYVVDGDSWCVSISSETVVDSVADGCTDEVMSV